MSSFSVVTEDLIIAAQAMYDVANSMAYQNPEVDIAEQMAKLPGTASGAAGPDFASAATDKMFALRLTIQSLGDALADAANNYIAVDQAAAGD